MLAPNRPDQIVRSTGKLEPRGLSMVAYASVKLGVKSEAVDILHVTGGL